MYTVVPMKRYNEIMLDMAHLEQRLRMLKTQLAGGTYCAWALLAAQ
jgi:hypothetical protein